MNNLGNLAKLTISRLLTSAVVAAAMSFPAAAATTYKLEFSPALDGGYAYPATNGINNSGVVVSTADYIGDIAGTAAFQWDTSGVLTNITPGGAEAFYGRAVAINTSGQVLVEENSQIYILDNGARTLLQTGLLNPYVLSMNDAATVVGYYQASVNGTSQNRAFVFANGTATDLGTLPSGGISSARDINNFGHIVGSAINSSSQSRAVMWRDGAMIDLGTLPGDTSSVATAINDSDQIVGASTGANGTRGFLWHNGVMTDLGNFADNKYIQPQDINNEGQIVGYARATNSVFVRATAFTWKNGVYQDLNPLIAQTGIYGCNALAVSNAGHISGSCINNLYRVTPIADGVDVAVEVSTPSSAARQAEPLVYTMRVANTGSLPASGVTLSDTLPAGVTFGSVSTTQGSCTGNTTISCAIGDLAPGAIATVTLTVTPTQTTFSLVNTATVTANETDANPLNNSSSASVWVQAAIIYTDMSVIIAGPSSAKARTNITYTITVKNDGPGTAPYTTVTNNVAANLYYVSSSTNNGSCGGVSCTIGQLAAGESATITLVLRPLLRGTYTSKSSLSFGTTDKNSSNNTATITTVVR